MDEDLLDKYFAGQCTPEEAARVRRWLEKPVANENRLLGQSWHNIRRYIQAGANGRVNPWARYFAAASVVLLTVYAAAWNLSPRGFVIRNTSQQYEAFDARGLQFRLPPEAAARINMSVVSRSADLKFCGNVRIHNTSGNDVDMKLNLSCASAEHPDHTAVLKARKDKKYVAFQYRFKSDELVVVEEDRIFDLPLPLQQKALEVLEI